MNTELLLEVKKAILENPDHFDMGDWGFEDDEVDSKGPIDCGTTCCISGWASWIADPKNWPDNSTDGDKYLGEECRGLFYGDWHPDVYPGSDLDEITPEDVARAIDHFIENDGWPNMNTYHPDYEEE